MAEVLTMTHEGTFCAIPAKQALSAKSLDEDVELVTLWGGDARTPRTSIRPQAAPVSGPLPNPGVSRRTLSVRTGRGPRWLRCSNMRIRELPGSAIFPLPPFLGDVLGLPHVVALGELEGGLLWLVDLERFYPDS